MSTQLPPRGTLLTERECEVLALAADGRTNREIGRRLNVSTDTAKTHLRRLCARLGARDRAHAVAIAIRAGVIR